MNKGDKVICINNKNQSGFILNLEIGNVYTISRHLGNVYAVINDEGDEAYYTAELFISMSTYRGEVIERILE